MAEPKKKPGYAPESYDPKAPEIVGMVEQARGGHETFVETISEFCSIVDRAETHMVGIGVPVSFESQGYPDASPEFYSGTMNDYFIAKKYIADDTVAFLAEALGVNLEQSEIISARYDVQGDGNYNVIVGLRINSLKHLPEFLPEHTVTLTLPACRYARIEINEQKRENRSGYDERMQADEYFIGAFRDTGYIYNLAGVPMNTWDNTGDVLTKYEPIRQSVNENDHFDTFVCKPVLLPPWKIACCTAMHGKNEGNCISDYFKVATEVYRTGLSRFNQNGDFYGFPIDYKKSYKSCFGSRVISFEGLPDSVEKITLPGGMYVHVTQKEFNGDNPSMPYEVAFHHMKHLYFTEYPAYEFDKSRKVIARFRQANCASVFVPVRLKRGKSK